MAGDSEDEGDWLLQHAMLASLGVVDEVEDGDNMMVATDPYDDVDAEGDVVDAHRPGCYVDDADAGDVDVEWHAEGDAYGDVDVQAEGVASGIKEEVDVEGHAEGDASGIKEEVEDADVEGLADVEAVLADDDAYGEAATEELHGEAAPAEEEIHGEAAMEATHGDHHGDGGGDTEEWQGASDSSEWFAVHDSNSDVIRVKSRHNKNLNPYIQYRLHSCETASKLDFTLYIQRATFCVWESDFDFDLSVEFKLDVDFDFRGQLMFDI